MPDTQVTQVAPDRLPEAIRVLVGGDSTAARAVLSRIEAGRIRLIDAWAVQDHAGRIDSVAAAVQNPGRTLGLVISPLALARHPRDAAAAVAAAAGTDRGDADLIQAMFDPGRRAEIACVREAGFEALATLRFMDRPLEPSVPASASEFAAGHELVPAESLGREGLCRLLGRTYLETLDCPKLAGRRRLEDVLDGHRGTGRFDPNLWTALCVAGDPVGLAMVNANPEAECLELVYLGLAPEFRGRGLGSLLLETAIRNAQHGGLPRLSLAVDEQNRPAIRLYRRHGFVPGTARIALIRSR